MEQSSISFFRKDDMVKFTYSIPSEFTDEDKYFKYFTKKNMAVIIITGFIMFLLYKLTGSLFGKPFIGLIIGGIIMLVSILCVMVKIPETLYLEGGGQTILTILTRKYVRKRNKVIYIKGYDDWGE